MAVTGLFVCVVDGVPWLHPLTDMQITDERMLSALTLVDIT